MTDERVRELARKADQLREYIELVLSFLILLTFVTAVYSLAYNLRLFIGGERSVAAVISFLSTVLLLGILSDVYGLTVDELLDRRTLNGFMSLLIIATSIGVLEDWIGSLGALNPVQMLVYSSLFSGMLLLGFVGFHVTR
ncbi:MAG: hypothetical protein ABEJ75_03405 [Candidatus Nanohaloarchaea archaeon]